MPEAESKVAAGGAEMVAADESKALAGGVDAAITQIDGDVGPTTGDVDAPGDVVVKGTVRSSFTVRSAGSIVVEGAIESAVVEAAMDVTVLGGIADHGGGRVEAGRHVVVKFCHGANIRAGGNVTVDSDSMHSRIHARGKLVITQGAIVGGYAYGREEAAVRDLGNDAGAPTYVAVGIDPADYAEAENATATLNRKQQTINRIRTEIQPLMCHVRRLTAQQREKATELLFEADTMEQQVCNQRTALEEKAAASRPHAAPILHVCGKVHAKVAVIFGGRMASFDAGFRGPLKLTQRSLDGNGAIVLMSGHSGRSRTLPCVSSQEHPVWNSVQAGALEGAPPA